MEKIDRERKDQMYHKMLDKGRCPNEIHKEYTVQNKVAEIRDAEFYFLLALTLATINSS